MLVTNTFLVGPFAPVSDEITAFDLPVTGRVPDELNGRYLRNGPNPLGLDDPGGRRAHLDAELEHVTVLL
jgi:carotenoid cleavage dioxygenase-like enzyme